MIGIYIELYGINNLHYEDIDKGNPGIGGVEYLSLLLTKLLSKNNFDVILYSDKPRIYLGEKIICKQVNSPKNAIIHFKNTYCSQKFIIHARYIPEIIDINDKTTHFFLWHHNIINEYTIKKTLLMNNITHVFLTKYQLKLYWKYPKIIRNSVIIPNANISNYPNLNRNMRCNNITFIGSIVKSKNFHILLQTLPNITRVSNTKLLVVGSNSLYARDIHLGPHNITEPIYEKELFDTINKHKLNDRVIFLGLKTATQIANEILPITKVGVVNPGYNKNIEPETFCLSATQLGSFGIPVIGGNIGGLKYTLPKKCGYRINSSEDLSKRILELLKNNKKNIKYGKNYQKYIKKHFDIKLFEQKWINILSGKSNKYTHVTLFPYITIKSFLKVCSKVNHIIKTKHRK